MRLEPWRIATFQSGGKEADTRKETRKDSKNRSVLEAKEKDHFKRIWICWYQYLWNLQKNKNTSYKYLKRCLF